MKYLACFSICLLLIGSTMAQDVNIDNRIDCYMIIDLSDACSAPGNGPYDSPDNTLQTYALTIDGITGGAGTVDQFRVTDANNGNSDLVDFTCNTPLATSPYRLPTITCDNRPVYVVWGVAGGDFNIVIRY